MLKSNAIKFAIAFGLLSWATSANAATYAYTGPNFTSFSQPPGEINPYTAAMNVTGWFTTFDPIVANLVLTDIYASVIDFSFTDGLKTLVPSDVGGAPPFKQFLIGTNALGEIIEWDISLLNDTDQINTNLLFTFVDDISDVGKIFTSNGVIEGRSFGEGGTWQRTDISAVPLPAALPLLAAGLGAMGFMGWRRKQKSRD